MSKINCINNKSGFLETDSGASGDPFVQFDINGTGEFRIGVDDTDDSFRISQGSALGTNDTFVVSAAGEITKPLQPAFSATEDGYSSFTATGDGTVYTVPYDTEIFDNNSDYSAPTFTAPIAGKYKLSGHVLFGGLTAHVWTSMYVEICTSNRTYRSMMMKPSFSAGAADLNLGPVVALCDMDASDTAIIRVAVDGSTKNVLIGYTNRGLFSGTLVC